MSENHLEPSSAFDEPNSALEPHFSIDIDAAIAYLEFNDRFARSKQICICGHTLPSHRYSTTIGYQCRPNNLACPCEMPRPVFYATDARHFKRSTRGPGMRHALSQGMVSLRKSGGRGEWLEKLACQVPGCSNLEIVPAPVTREKRVMDRASDINVFLCREHCIEFGGDLIW